MRKTDIKKVYAPLYGVPITFVCGFDAARKLGMEPEPHWGAMASTHNGQVYLTLGCPEANNLNTVAHESLHCAWRVLELVGIEVEARNHEALAYLVGWIMQEAKTFFDKHYPAE